MTQTTTSRRAVLGALAITPIIGIGATIAAPTYPGDDHELLEAWEGFRTGVLEINAMGYAEGPEVDAAEAAIWQRIDPLDGLIGELPARTPAGAVAKLFRALWIVDSSREVEHAAISEDYAWLAANSHSFDYQSRLIADSICTLANLRGVA